MASVQQTVDYEVWQVTTTTATGERVVKETCLVERQTKVMHVDDNIREEVLALHDKELKGIPRRQIEVRSRPFPS